MKPVTQRPNGCLMACVASILEVPLEALPDLDAECARRGEAEWGSVLEHVLSRYGYVALHYHCHDPAHSAVLGCKCDQSSPQIAPIGYHIAVGINPRHGLHATVARDGRIVHDPEPDRLGLESITSWILLMPNAA